MIIVNNYQGDELNMAKTLSEAYLNFVRDVMNIDPMEITEEMVKKSFGEFTDPEKMKLLGVSAYVNEIKERVLASIGDTRTGTSWENFKKILQVEGFKEALRYDYIIESDYCKPSIEEAILYYHSAKGLLVWGTSYGNKFGINDANLYGFFKYTKPVEKVFVPSKWIEGAGYEDIVLTDELKDAIQKVEKCRLNRGPWIDILEGLNFSQDVRQGFIMTIRSIESHFEFMPIWPRDAHVWFVDYADTKENPNLVGASDMISVSKIKKCPKEVQAILAKNIEKWEKEGLW
jgi:hypothetical protein